MPATPPAREPHHSRRVTDDPDIRELFWRMQAIEIAAEKMAAESGKVAGRVEKLQIAHAESVAAATASQQSSAKLMAWIVALGTFATSATAIIALLK